MHWIKNILLALLLCISGTLMGQVKTDSSGIWFKNARHFPGRFAYSQAILWPTSISGHIGLYILKDDFEAGRIKQSHIAQLYNAVYDDAISSKHLMKKIRDIRPLEFPQNRKKMQRSNGDWYFKLT